MPRQIWLAVVVACGLIVFFSERGCFDADGNLVQGRRTGAASYLVQEDMEGVGTPAGWLDTGSPDWDYTTTPIHGSESWQSDLGVERSRYDNTPFPGQANAYGFCALTLPAASSNITIFGLIVAGDASGQADIQYRASGALRLRCGSVNLDTSVLGAGTYYIWLDYEKGTGSDAVARLYYSATTTKPGSPNLEITTGTSTQDVTSVMLQGYPSGAGLIIDDVLVSDSSIGSNPWSR